MKKYLHVLIFWILCLHVPAQNLPTDYTTVQLTAIAGASSAAEGDLYHDYQQDIYYLGATNGSLIRLDAAATASGNDSRINDSDDNTYVEAGTGNRIDFGLNGELNFNFTDNRLETLNSEQSVYIGDNVAQYNSGNTNIGIGNNVIKNGNSSRNTALGNNAGENNSGSENIFIGLLAGQNSGNATKNISIGKEAGLNNSGDANIILGQDAAKNSGNSTNNVYIGYDAATNKRGNDNIVLGASANKNGGNGNENVIIGANAAPNANGSGNVFIGRRTAANGGGGNRNIVIGEDLSLASNSTSNQLNIGNMIYGENLNGIQNTVSNGRIGIGTKYPTQTLHVDGGFRLEDGTEGTGKILTSDANGNASWESPQSNSFPQILVDANRTSSYSMNQNYATVVYNSASTNIGSAYNTGNGIFTAPADGLYQIIYNNQYSYVNYRNHTPFNRILINNSVVEMESANGSWTNGNGNANINYSTNHGNTIVELKANNTVRIQQRERSNADNISPETGSGQHRFKIIRLK